MMKLYAHIINKIACIKEERRCSGRDFSMKQETRLVKFFYIFYPRSFDLRSKAMDISCQAKNVYNFKVVRF